MNRPIEELLAFYVAHYSSHRRMGHTTAAIQGAKKAAAILLCHCYRFGSTLALDHKVTTVCYNDFDKLRGFDKPLVWDNAALVEVFAEAMHRIDDLDIRCSYAERRADACELARKEAEEKLKKTEARTTRQLFTAAIKSLFKR